MIIKIWDIVFAHAKGCGDGSGLNPPKKIQWVRNGPDTDITFYTDQNLGDHRIPDIKNSPAKKKIAWIIEPQIINQSPYNWIKDNYKLFDKVITHHKHLLSIDQRFIYGPIGGCWVPENQHKYNGPRNGQFSLIASWKLMTPMHQMRHDIMRLFGQKYGIEGYGEAFNRHVKFKHEVLNNYRYNIVVENCSVAGYFTEKLLDCIAAYCVPIYYGDPDIRQIFDIPTFTTLDELENLLKNPPLINYSTLEMNYNIGKQYFIPEDWIYDNVIETLRG